MELTFSCQACGTIGHVSPLESADAARCRQCGTCRPLRGRGAAASQLTSCPWCATTDLYVQKDFSQGLGLLIAVAGFAISTIFWYYEMPIATMGVLVASLVLDWALYQKVPDVTICYRCQSQVRGAGSNPDGRFKPFDLAIGERYRQERIRVQQLQERRASAEGRAVVSGPDGH
jgi:hypothetical protein